MKVISILLTCFLVVKAGPATEVAAYKGQFCTDPRTMRKHAAYTEWADAYSCTRHRCQPGGRNLAIYTVGCKRVEAPESAIECEEVVEDTNMQFPYCCTRLRCLVVVRGEVWTRVLGQPWETLPAAPWSHMYKMKKPPPADGTFLPKTEEGPVYELQMPETAESGGDDKVLRSIKKPAESPDCNDVVARAAPAPAPDIVIALSTGSDKEMIPIKENIVRHMTREERSQNNNIVFEEGEPQLEEEAGTEKEKSEERYYANSQKQVKPQQPTQASAEQQFYEISQKNTKQSHQLASWTEIPQNQWQERDPSNENGPAMQQRSNIWNDRERHEPEALRVGPPEMPSAPSPAQTWEHQSIQPEFPPSDENRRNEKKEEKPGNLQALVDAIGTRMRDIESVVARMSEKVHEERKESPEQSFRSSDRDHNYHEGKEGKAKKANPDNEHYKRFSPSSRSKYVRTSPDATTEQPLFVEDTNLNGYFSDASNSLINRRTPPKTNLTGYYSDVSNCLTIRRTPPKEPAATYMAPVVDTRRKGHAETADEREKKHKKKTHKKKHAKGHHKKHHSKDERRRKFRLNSVELDRNAVSLEDSSGANSNANNATFDNSID